MPRLKPDWEWRHARSLVFFVMLRVILVDQFGRAEDDPRNHTKRHEKNFCCEIPKLNRLSNAWNHD